MNPTIVAAVAAPGVTALVGMATMAFRAAFKAGSDKVVAEQTQQRLSDLEEGLAQQASSHQAMALQLGRMDGKLDMLLSRKVD